MEIQPASLFRPWRLRLNRLFDLSGHHRSFVYQSKEWPGQLCTNPTTGRRVELGISLGFSRADLRCLDGSISQSSAIGYYGRLLK